MERVGVRELRQNASRVLARVKAGDTVEVTERGRPVARIVPLAEGDEYDRLVDAGAIRLGTQEVWDLTPVRLAPGIRLSDELDALRIDDWR